MFSQIYNSILKENFVVLFRNTKWHGIPGFKRFHDDRDLDFVVVSSMFRNSYRIEKKIDTFLVDIHFVDINQYMRTITYNLEYLEPFMFDGFTYPQVKINVNESDLKIINFVTNRYLNIILKKIRIDNLSHKYKEILTDLLVFGFSTDIISELLDYRVIENLLFNFDRKFMYKYIQTRVQNYFICKQRAIFDTNSLRNLNITIFSHLKDQFKIRTKSYLLENLTKLEELQYIFKLFRKNVGEITRRKWRLLLTKGEI